MGVYAGIANLAGEAIEVLVADALIDGSIAIGAAAFRIIGALFTNFLGTCSATAIARQCIAIITTFVCLDETIAAASRNT